MLARRERGTSACVHRNRVVLLVLDERCWEKRRIDGDERDCAAEL